MNESTHCLSNVQLYDLAAVLVEKVHQVCKLLEVNLKLVLPQLPTASLVDEPAIPLAEILRLGVSPENTEMARLRRCTSFRKSL